MKNLAVLLKYFARYRWKLILGAIFVTVSNYFRILQPQMIREAMDLVLANLKGYKDLAGKPEQAQLMAELGKSLLLFGGLVLLFALLMGLFMYWMRQTIIVMSRLIEYDMRKELFEQYEKLSLSFYRKNNTGDLMARVTEDVSKVRMAIGPAILYGFNLISLFSLTIWSMLKVNVELTLYSLIPLPLLSFSIYYVSDLISKRSEAIQKQLAKLNSIAQETYSGIRVVKSYVQEKPMTSFFSEESENYKNQTMRLAKVESLFFPVMLFMIGMSVIIVVYVGGLKVASGEITPGNIAEFVIYVNMLTWPVTSIGWIASLVQQASASQKRINEFMEIKPDIINPIQKIEPIEGNIVFKNVAFAYPDSGIKALKGISFDLKKGQKMAIIGKTGCGKTTIADLLVRMYDVNSGEILIDGKNIKNIDLANLRQKVGYVPQDVFLFSDTVAQNIAFGTDNMSQDTIEYYAKSAAIHNEILDLSEGYNTLVGERGVTLSGGQKQRISIARALIKKPDIVLLDDCLSAVDTNTEKQITNFLNTELAKKTAIVITHRIYGLMEFDKIIVLEDGLIIEEGTHEQLLEKGGYYADTYEQQKLQEV